MRLYYYVHTVTNCPLFLFKIKGELIGGELTGGELTRGELTRGELTGGELTGGELTGIRFKFCYLLSFNIV